MKNKNLKTIEKEEEKEFSAAINALKEKKAAEGIIPNDNKKIKIINGHKDFSGKKLKIQKSFFKNGEMYSYVAGTAWEDLDAFAKKNIHFSESDFI